jgi:hypothetical protein
VQEIERAMNRMNATEEAKKNKTLEKERMSDEVLLQPRHTRNTYAHTQHIHMQNAHTHS